MKYLKPIIKGAYKPIKRLKVYFKQKAGWLDIPKIMPFKGYGNEKEIIIQGMVIEDKGLTKPHDKLKFWQNMLATIKRFSGDEIAGVNVKATFREQTQFAETDEQGFFLFSFKIDNNEEQTVGDWLSVQFELVDEIVENQPKTTATGYIRFIPQGNEHIIVSDVDDTVMVSHSTQTLKKLRLMLFKNALTRAPFPGISFFYKALAKGTDTAVSHPFFYVSSSEWNLYDLLDDFFSYNQLPRGVFLLKRLEHSILKFWKSGGGNHQHKFDKIRHLLQFYPNRAFILIGDSGQRDPEIYSRLALEFPGRIETIFIRKIRSRSFLNKNEEHTAKLTEVQTGYFEVKNSHEAALIALRRGYISSKYFSETEAGLSKQNASD
ncbi:Phosphatidate phosphatase APP1 [Tangfeifania diversioriginum]|uniref:Phosphatidate phosphatase APP1 n=1 Tax=Tangfeifania diversioriginum TaxID=1168035 RepID=A0A1M6C5A7_9BACT|nr:phosphatase domain-containing protein [Tangfeifania diversioriginum]SHI55918.1 Phosphatidate phosphatase APP1 [Tangfeifania diversioriginum]